LRKQEDSFTLSKAGQQDSTAKYIFMGDFPIGKSAAAFSHSEIARCFYSERTRLSAAATKSLDTDCVTNDDEDILPTAVKVRRWILPFSRRN